MASENIHVRPAFDETHGLTDPYEAKNPDNSGYNWNPMIACNGSSTRKTREKRKYEREKGKYASLMRTSIRGLNRRKNKLKEGN